MYAVEYVNTERSHIPKHETFVKSDVLFVGWACEIVNQAAKDEERERGP